MYEQINERAMWEFFVGKVHGKTFSEWRDEALNEAKAASPASMAASDIIADSLAISGAIAVEGVSAR